MAVIKIDYKNKIIEKAFIHKNKTFGTFLSQYAVFENEVRFENCTFNEDVIFGDEFCDSAFCRINSDLIFDGCTFLKKVKLDGLQCAGHVVFKGQCKFEYNGEGQEEFALSMSNAKIGIGISITDSDFKSGINFSAIHVEQLGCQFFNIKLNNPTSNINFISSYMGRELSINYSNIICERIDFERTSVDPVHGSIQIKGKYYYHKQVWEVLQNLLRIQVNPEEIEWLASIYKDFKPYVSRLIVKYSDKINFEDVVQSIDDISKGEIKDIVDFQKKESFNSDRYAIYGDLIAFADYVVIVANNRIYVSKKTSDSPATQVYELDDYANSVFSDFELMENERWESFKSSTHVGVPIIYAMTNYLNQYIAVYDDNIGFKTYKWNYIECSAVSNMFRAQVGTGLYVGQSEFNVSSLDIHGLIASNDIKFEDIVFRMTSFLASEVQSKNFTIRNTEFIFNPEKLNYWINSPDEKLNWGIDMNFAKITNKMDISSVSSLNTIDENSFCIIANYMVVGNIFKIADIINNSESSRTIYIDLKNSFLNQWVCNGVDIYSWCIETENVHFEDLRINDNWPVFEIIKIFCTTRTIIGTKDIIKGIYPIHFFREVDKLLDKFDRYGEQYKFWKMRNEMRLYRDHRRSYKIHILLNKYLLNYGWSPWRIVIWLLLLIASFDIITCTFFRMDILTSIVNGLVEFIPISFNEPIVEQLHGVNPQDPKYGPPLMSLGYSALVTGYRLCSYILLSVLIAAWGGFFRKRNQ